MTKRVFTAALWLFVTWYAWNVIGWMIGLPSVIGPVIGLVAGLLVGYDPFHWFWAVRETGSAAATTSGVDPAVSKPARVPSA